MHKMLMWLAGVMMLTGTAINAAENYPARPITIVVPFAAGGSNDIVARAIGKKLNEAWGQPVIIDNRAGAGSVIGTNYVAGAAPDGHTLLLVSVTFTINPAVKTKLPYDTLNDFVPVAYIGQSPLLLAAANTFPASTPKELIALAKSKPGAINYASAGPGSINHIAAALLAVSAGIDLVHIPYKGGALAINDLVGSHVDIYASSMPQILQIVKSGQAKALAVTSLQRSPSLPDVPTLDEAGLPGFEASSWWGVVAPARTPPEIVATLNTEINKALNSEEMQRFLEGEGAQAAARTPQQFKDLIAAEVQRWTTVAKKADIHAD